MSGKFEAVSLFLPIFAGLFVPFSLLGDWAILWKTMCVSNLQTSQRTTTTGVGDAVGVSETRWFVASVGTNTEKACRDRLTALGYEAFVASRTETHYWKNGKKKEIEVIVISGLLFIHCTELQRRAIVQLPYVKYFMTNKAGTLTKNGFRPLVTIPERQMDMLRFMLFRADAPVEFLTSRYVVGDSVRVLRGQLQGFEGKVVQVRGSSDHYIGVRLDCLGCAVLRIETTDIEKI